jgi:hypothetical protein
MLHLTLSAANTGMYAKLPATANSDRQVFDERSRIIFKFSIINENFALQSYCS